MGRLKVVLAIVVVLLLVAQAFPYGRGHDNPPSAREWKFDSAKTERLFGAACADCHSDHTDWPWYSYVAPMSWLVEHDVKDGRQEFDVSQWDRSQPPLDEVLESVREGEMPPLQYKPLHADARLSAAEREQLARGLERTLQASPPRS